MRDEFCRSPNEPRSARGHDPANGALLAELELPPPGLTGSPLVADGRIWGITATDRAVLAIPLDGSPSETFTFESVDISPLRPPPPAPIDAETTERKLLEQLRKRFYGGWISRDRVTGEEEHRPLIGGVEIDDVRLECSFPDTRVVVTFTSSERRGGFASLGHVRFGRQTGRSVSRSAWTLTSWRTSRPVATDFRSTRSSATTDSRGSELPSIAECLGRPPEEAQAGAGT
jgi:hypothetical protein